MTLAHAISRPLRATCLVAATVFAPTHSVLAQVGTPSSGALTLRMVLDSVRANHPTIRAADSRVDASRGSRSTARAFGNPVLSYQVNQTPFPGGQPLALEREATTTATFPLEFLYQRGPRVARADAELRSATAEAINTRQRLGLAAADAFYRVALAQIQVATTRDVVGWLDTLVAYNRFRVAEGAAAEADLIRAEVERDRSAAEATLGEAELLRARAALDAFISNDERANARTIVAVDATPLALPASSAFNLDARPDVRAARERVTASAAAVSSERTMIFREVGATIGAMQTGPTTSMVAGVSLPLPSFNTNRGEIQRARAERAVAGFELATQERLARAEFNGALEAARVLSARVSTLAGNDSASFLARVDEARRIALGTYREGAIPLFQVIDATRSWADARMTYYQTLIAQHQSVLALIVAEGLDLFTAAPQPRATGDASR